MRQRLLAVLALSLLAAAPSRTQTYVTGQVINPDHVTENEDNIYQYLQSGVDTFRDGTIETADIANDAITAAKIPVGAVTTSEILDDTITTSDLADADHGDFTYSGGVATLDAGVVNGDELAATLTFSDDDLVNLSAINNSDAAEGLILPQASSCSSATAEGQICWDTDDSLWIGNGSAAAQQSTQFLVGTFTRDTTDASGTQDVTGLGFTPKAILFLSVQSTAVGEMGVGWTDGTNSNGLVDQYNTTAGRWAVNGSGVSIFIEETSTDNYFGSVAFGSGQFTVTWTKVGSPTGTLTVVYLAMR